MKKVKYLGGGWTDSYIPKRNVIIGNIYTVYRIDCDGDYWFLDGDGYHTCMKPQFMKDVENNPEDNHTSQYYVISHNSILNTDLVLYKTDLLTLAIDYRDKNGGFITQVLS